MREKYCLLSKNAIKYRMQNQNHAYTIKEVIRTMKRSIALLLAAVLVLTMAFALTACGSDKEEKAETADDITVFSYKGASVALDSKAADAVSALGEAQDVKSEMSCHGEGEDRTYTYADFILKTYPKDGEDHVLEILISKAGVPTSKGIEVGSSLDDVTAAYGSDCKTIGTRYVYDAGEGKTLRFNIKDNKVVEIDYYFNV